MTIVFFFFFNCPVLAVLCRPALNFLAWQSSSGTLILAWQSSSGTLILAWQSSSGTLILAWQSSSGSLILVVLFWQECTGGLVSAFLSWLSWFQHEIKRRKSNKVPLAVSTTPPSLTAKFAFGCQ
jgi:hypothetical protein